MTESVRAVRASVQIGSLTVDGFMLPDGSYRMSQTQASATTLSAGERENGIDPWRIPGAEGEPS